MSALSPINRESELRTDAAKLAQLWSSAHIIHMVDRRLSAADDSLTFIDAAAVTALSDVFVEGDRFFLGIGRDDNQPYFAWHSAVVHQHPRGASYAFCMYEDTGRHRSCAEFGLILHYNSAHVHVVGISHSDGN